MKRENQVVSLELAKQLKALDVPQDSLFYWNIDLTGTHLEYIQKIIEGGESYSAFTFNELYEFYYSRIGEVIRMENIHPDNLTDWLAEHIIFKLTVSEKWADIKGYEGLYQVSSLGNVCSIGRNTTHGTTLKPNKNRSYLAVSMCRNGKQRTLAVHKLVANAFLDFPNGKTQINHKDGNKFNNVVSNLEWATPAENKAHSLRMGLSKAPKGEKHWKAKLSDKDIVDIREKRKTKTLKELSQEYSVAISTIGDITTNRRRKI